MLRAGEFGLAADNVRFDLARVVGAAAKWPTGSRAASPI